MKKFFTFESFIVLTVIVMIGTLITTIIVPYKKPNINQKDITPNDVISVTNACYFHGCQFFTIIDNDYKLEYILVKTTQGCSITPRLKGPITK